MKKRFILILICSLALSFMFVGCDSGDSDDNTSNTVDTFKIPSDTYFLKIEGLSPAQITAVEGNGLVFIVEAGKNIEWGDVLPDFIKLWNDDFSLNKMKAICPLEKEFIKLDGSTLSVPLFNIKGEKAVAFKTNGNYDIWIDFENGFGTYRVQNKTINSTPTIMNISEFTKVIH